MFYTLLIIIIVLQIVFYIKIKKYIRAQFIEQHNEILIEIKNKTDEIYRDMAKSELTDEDL